MHYELYLNAINTLAGQRHNDTHGIGYAIRIEESQTIKANNSMRHIKT